MNYLTANTMKALYILRSDYYQQRLSCRFYALTLKYFVQGQAKPSSN